ncbi:MAG: TrkH family potassium uptake protein [Deltaproteobacteria bacterium]|nr:TrkH family potassium uptake protein [Deltaproteobacteria bacterium]
MRSQWRDYRGVLRPVGAVVMGLGVAIGLSALVGWLFNELDPPADPARLGGELALLVAAATAMGVGYLGYWWSKKSAPTATITRREAVLSVALIWISAGVFGALPFVFGAGMSFHDALFEAVSGLTTTGATVIPDIEIRLSRSLLLWRSLIQWLGGMGIVVLFVAVFPNIGAGGKVMFGKEVPGTTAEGLRPRIAETSRLLWQLYAALTGLEVLALYLQDMSLFESICHAFTTMSTGGFSTRDASVAAFDSFGIEMTIATFMLIGTANYGLYYSALKGRSLRTLFRNVEFKAFLGIVAVSVMVMTFGLLEVHDNDLVEAFRYAYFMVATTISSTGYGTDDYSAYPPPMLMIIIVLMFVGGCSGSTAGGIKVERIVLMAKISWTEVRRSFRPSLVHVVRMGRVVVPQSALTDVAVFFMIFMLCLGSGSALLTTLDGVPLPTAMGAVLTSLSNMGPAPFHLGADNFAEYSAGSKLFCTFAMLLGRLEFYALLALFVPGFWRR